MSGNLTHSPADVLRHCLISLGYGVIPSVSAVWPIFCDSEPDKPDNCITLYNTQGKESGRTMTDGERQEFPGFQVRVRCVNPVDGFAKARAIAVALDEEVYDEGVTVNPDTGSTTSENYLLHSVSRSSQVIPLGKETPTSKRNVFTVNGVFSLRQLT